MQEDQSPEAQQIRDLLQQLVIRLPPETDFGSRAPDKVGSNFYFDAVYGSSFTAINAAAAHYSVIPSAFITGSVTVYLTHEVIRQVRTDPRRTINPEAVLPGRVFRNPKDHAVFCGGILVFAAVNEVESPGGWKSWNRYDTFFWAMLCNIIVMLIIKLYIWYHNKYTVKRYPV